MLIWKVMRPCAMPSRDIVGFCDGCSMWQALHVLDMLKSTGARPDTIMYTNLITGARCRPDELYRFQRCTERCA